MLDRTAITEAEFAEFVNYPSEECTIRSKPYQDILCFAPNAEADEGHFEVSPVTNVKGELSAARQNHILARDLAQSPKGAGDASQPHDMRRRFVKTTPKWMSCTDRLDLGHSLEPKRNALECRYLNPNSPGLIRWQIFDLDRSDAALAFDDANVAVPNVIIENPKNGHAHYAYALETGVAWSDAGRHRPQAYLKAVRRGMTKRLGGDPNFSHYLSKNPLHTDWRTTWLSRKPYTLNDLSIWLEPDDMRKVHKSRSSENEFSELGRNCSLTSDLAKFGLRTAWRYQTDAFAQKDFGKDLRCYAFTLNSEFDEPLPVKEVLVICKSIEKWVLGTSTAERFSEIQKWRAETRRRRNMEIIGSLIRPDQMTSAELAAALDRSERTGRRYLAEIRTKPQSERQAKPWLALGISRRTYYKRKKAGAL